MAAAHFKYWPDGVPHEISVPPLRIHDNLTRTAQRVPAAVAISYYGTEITYSQLAEDVDRLAGYLSQKLGVAPGDRVPLIMQNCPQFVVAYYGILRADAIVVPINPMLRAAELGRIAAELEARVAICGLPQHAAVAELIGRNVLENAIVAHYGDALPEGGAPPGLRLPAEVTIHGSAEVEGPGHHAWRKVIAARLSPVPSAADANDLAVIVYTSGSTGESRGCMHRHRTVQANIHAYAHWAPMDETSAILGALPFFHVTGMQVVMNGAILSGARNVIMTRWDADAALELTERQQITHWRLITTMMIDLLSRPGFVRERLRSVRWIGGGGAAMPEALARRLEETTGLAYVEGYGLSETMAATHINPPDRPKRQCLGIPFIGVDSRIIDPETGRELATGEVGEIVICGPQVFAGYWRKPGLTEAAFTTIEGKRYFRSGDLGYVDEEGYYFLVDRLKRMINAAGLKIWPAEIEALLHAHPAVNQACVVAVPDPRRGETAKAIIVSKGGAETAGAAEITAWLASRLAAYKVPTQYAFAECLPLLASGKVDWRQVQEDERRAASAEKAQSE
jgi:fatty-acyl-CoA synthase